ncbi:lipid-A-disaccharide synthase N-terminal domain-containing protein [Luteimonas sp. MC1782]|nr:lipid-A-disaccharide synthase N-terminal domain-containing protein [Luteimonas sp. MC1895]
MNETIAALDWTGIAVTPWKLIGLFGALLFGARWLVQFGASRRAGRAVVPRSFWVISLCGSAMTLAYFLFSDKQDAVGVLQNLLPALTAAYSLRLELRTARPAAPQADSNSGGWTGASSGSRKPASPTPANR